MQMTIIFNIMALFGFTVLIFLGCDNVRMAGATLPYFNRSVSQRAYCNLIGARGTYEFLVFPSAM